MPALEAGVAEDLAVARARAKRGGPSLAELQRAAEAARTAAREAAHERDAAAQRVELARERLAALETALAEREGIPPAARALAEAGERLALSLLDVDAWPRARSRGCARVARLRARRGGLALARSSSSSGHASKASAALPSSSARRAADERPPVAGARPLTASCTAPRRSASCAASGSSSARSCSTRRTGSSSREEGHGYDVDRGELWFAGETAEAVLLELEARRRALAGEVETLQAAAAAAATRADEAERAGHAAEKTLAAAPQRERPLASVELLERIAALAGRAGVALAAGGARIQSLEAGAGDAPGSDRGAELGAELARTGELEAELRRRAAEAAARAGGFLSRFGAVEAEPGDRRRARAGAGARRDRATSSRPGAAEAAVASARARDAEQAYAAAAPTTKRQLSSALLVRMCAATERLDEILLAAARNAERFEPPLRARADAGAARGGQLGAELRRLGADEVELRSATSAASERAGAVDVELARLDAEADEARRRRAAVDVEPAAGDDDDELADKVERRERRLEALGRVNPLAKEEYEAEKERLDELAEQRTDLEASLAELDKLHRELTETVETRFAETFARVSANFEEIAATLFPGGEGRLRLTEADDDEEAPQEEPGVEVELRPAGKRITRLSLLSGGEKALGAISFLFALFLAHPCPFYLLDEVEAALDDANIGRFVELLRSYADRAQFVVITHQKRTMEAADILYGVTMAGDGVSQIVSRRLPREESVALATA